MNLTRNTKTLKSHRKHAFREVLLSVIILFSCAISYATESRSAELFILPSFTVDAVQGSSNAGFIVHTTNTTTDLDPGCATPPIYTWSINSGVEGVDWFFTEGTNLNSTNVAIEFVTQGCYDISLNVLDCATAANAPVTEITVAGTPDIVVNNFTSLSSCTNDNIEVLWQLASNNNLNIYLDIVLDGVSISSTTLIASTSCTTPGVIDFGEVFSAGFLTAGNHQLIFNATGDINTTTASLTVDFEIFQAPNLSLFVPPVCEDVPVEGTVFSSEPNTTIVFSPTPNSVVGLTASYLPGTLINGEIISIIGDVNYGLITCSSTTSQNVVLQENPVVAALVTPATVCSGQSATVQGTGAAVFSWTSAPLPCQINNLSNQAIYCDILTSVSGTMTGSLTYGTTGVTCSTTVPFNIAVTPLPELSLVSSPTAGCENDLVSYEVSSVTNSGIAEYLWSVNGVPQSGSNAATFSTNLVTPSPFEVSVQVTEPSGCNAILDMSTVVWSNPVVTATPNTLNYPICLDENLPLCASGAGSYSWEGDPLLVGNCVDVPFGLFSNDGVVTITGSSTFGVTTCSSTFDFIVEYDAQPIIEVTSSGNVCAGDDITLTATGGVSYFWDSNPVADITNGNSITFTNLGIALISGNVIGAGANGCSTTTSFSYTINADPVATLSSLDADIVYCSTEIANIETSLNFGTPPYTIDWSLNGVNISTSSTSGPFDTLPVDLTSLASSTPTVGITVTDNNGCTAQDSFNLEVYEGVFFTLSATPACENEPVNFTATGNATNYDWPIPPFTVGGTNTHSAIMADGINVDVVGSINYTGTSIGNLVCSTLESTTSEVHLNPILNLASVNGNAFCEDIAPSLTASGADLYSWIPTPESQNGGSATYPSFSVSPLQGSVTGDIIYGSLTCSSSLNFSFDILALPNVQLNSANPIVCGSDDVLINTGGMNPSNNSFVWELNNTLLIESSNEVTIPLAFPTDAGINNISCTVTDLSGCVGVSDIDVEVLESPQLNISTSAICEGDTLVISASTNGSISWNIPSTSNIGNDYTFYPVNNLDSFVATSTLTTPSVLLSGNYDCLTDQSLIADVRPNPIINLSFNGLQCEGSGASIDISGAESYTWVSSPSEDSSSESPDLNNPGLNVANLSYSSLQAGILNISVTGNILYVDAGNLTCSSDAIIDRLINESPSFTFEGVSAICEGDCINFLINWNNTPVLPLSYDWSLDGMPYSNGDSFNFCPLYTSGSSNVALTVSDGNSCQASGALTVNMSEHPVISLGADITEGCSPLTVNFNSAAQLASVTAWNFGNGESLTGTSNPQITFECVNYSAGDCVYEVSFTAISETNPLCVTTGYESITVHPVPTPAFDFVEQAVCYDNTGDATILVNNLSSEISGLNCSSGIEAYSWTVFPTGITDCTETVNDSPNLIASGTGVFTIGLIVNDTNGCTAQVFEDFEVYPLPTPEVTFLQNSICLPTQVEILNTSGGSSYFELDVPGFVIPNNFESPFLIDVIYPGIYEAMFTVTSDDGCSVTINLDTAFQAWYPPIANFNVTPDIITFLDPIVTFTNLSEGETEHIWSFGDGDGASEVNPEHEYQRAGSYNVQLLVTNEYGCTDVASQTIIVNSELQIFVPNAFTPNNDGNNDAWKPQVNGEEYILSYECWVYDRWGKLVFNSTTLGEVWVGDNVTDGNGTHYVSSTESFSWRIEIKQIDGRGAKIATGNVFLVR
ncbi:MAG: hypothetical protein COA49_07230 [Bacteroidetes bacterium]|nr:MAG: hypothetical protein COA49_07230 [Bacteroidota bacterium]